MVYLAIILPPIFDPSLTKKHGEKAQNLTFETAKGTVKFDPSQAKLSIATDSRMTAESASYAAVKGGRDREYQLLLMSNTSLSPVFKSPTKSLRPALLPSRLQIKCLQRVARLHIYELPCRYRDTPTYLFEPSALRCISLRAPRPLTGDGEDPKPVESRTAESAVYVVCLWRLVLCASADIISVQINAKFMQKLDNVHQTHQPFQLYIRRVSSRPLCISKICNEVLAIWDACDTLLTPPLSEFNTGLLTPASLLHHRHHLDTSTHSLCCCSRACPGQQLWLAKAKLNPKPHQLPAKRHRQMKNSPARYAVWKQREMATGTPGRSTLPASAKDPSDWCIRHALCYGSTLQTRMAPVPTVVKSVARPIASKRCTPGMCQASSRWLSYSNKLSCRPVGL